jgi:nitrate reductase gamma subunit
MKTELLFRTLPYAALALGGVALLARTFLTHRSNPATENPAPPHERPAWGRFWRLSLLLLLIGHLLAIVSPKVVLRWNVSVPRLYALETFGLLVGLAALAGALRALWRHFGRAEARLGRVMAESALLSVALLAIATGVVTAVRFRWASSWATATLTPYLLSLAQGDADTTLVARLPPLVQLHVVAAFALVAVFPFTAAAAPVAVALRRPFGWIRDAAALMAVPLRAFARRHDPARRLWPDEDYGGPLPAIEAPAAGDAGPAAHEPESGAFVPDVKGS